MNDLPHTVSAIDKLRWNAQLNKNCHFRASVQGHRRHIAFGLPAVVINLIIGSVFFVQLSNQLPQWGYWAGAGLALVAALLGGVQTFFNFRQNFEGHREVGNEYLAIARECERLMAGYFDELIHLEDLSERVRELNKQYTLVTQKAEDYIVTDKVYRAALATHQVKDQQRTIASTQA